MALKLKLFAGKLEDNFRFDGKRQRKKGKRKENDEEMVQRKARGVWRGDGAGRGGWREELEL